MTYALSLPAVMYILAALLALPGAAAAFRTPGFQQGLLAFPRHRGAGVILVALALAWAGWLIGRMQIGFLEPWKWTLWLLTPVAIFLVVFYLDELLAARALGGLLLMIPTVILDAARWHESAWRYVPIVFAYALVVKGTLIVLAPYKFRRWATLLTGSAARCRAWGLATLGLAALFAVLGLAAF